MIDVVINYDKSLKVYKIYEPTTDTIIASSELTETFIKLSEFLISAGLISESDILNTSEINYHLDSAAMISMVESNVNLLKRLTQQAPSIFTSASQKFGGGGNPLPSQVAAKSGGKSSSSSSDKDGKKGTGFLRNTGEFSKSSFRMTGRKFGSR